MSYDAAYLLASFINAKSPSFRAEFRQYTTFCTVVLFDRETQAFVDEANTVEYGLLYTTGPWAR